MFTDQVHCMYKQFSAFTHLLCGLQFSFRNLIVFCTGSANIFYLPPPSLPRNGEKWRRRKRHWYNKWKGCYQACSPRLPAHLQPRQVDRCRGELPPPPIYLYPFWTVLRLQRQISRIASNLEVVSMIADIGQQQ
jgi:hypothetical protein